MDIIKPVKLEHLPRTSQEDTSAIINRLIDVINALSNRLYVVEQEIVAQRGQKVLDDSRLAHERNRRQANPL